MNATSDFPLQIPPLPTFEFDGRLFGNFAQSRLTQPLLAGQTDLFFDPDNFDLFPQPTVNGVVPITIWDGRVENEPEIVHATEITAIGRMTVVRAQEGTAERDHLNASRIKNALTADWVNLIAENLDATQVLFEWFEETANGLARQACLQRSEFLRFARLFQRKFGLGPETLGQGGTITGGDIINNTIVNSNLTAESVDYRTLAPSIRAAAALVGKIQIWPLDTVPEFWLPCDGTLRLKEDYTRPVGDQTADTLPWLYEIIGDTFNEPGDAVSNPDSFRLPNLLGRFPLGTSGAFPINASGGAETHKLTVAEMPSHTHPIVQNNADEYFIKFPALGAFGPAGASIPIADIVDPDSGGITIGPTGGSQPHNNMPPYLPLNFIIFAGRAAP